MSGKYNPDEFFSAERGKQTRFRGAACCRKGESTMKVFISIPRQGRPDNEIDAERTAIFQRIRKAYETPETPENFPVELIDQFYTGHEEDIPVEGDRVGVFYLGISLQHLMFADAAYFADNWQNARDCRIEHAVCREYNIPIIDKAELERREAVLDAQKRKQWALNECGVDLHPGGDDP